MNQEEIEFIQAFLFITLGLLMAGLLYGYIYHIFKNQKTGVRDYEKYSNLALDDTEDSSILEEIKGPQK